jgi:hypothetical protein
MTFATSETDCKPVLMIVVGRQRVGKTTFLNGLSQYLRGHGATFEIWDADKVNASHNLSGFHEAALQPVSTEPADVKAWLEERFTDLMERRFDAVLDVGGGETPLARLVVEVPIATALEGEGVRVVVAHVIGPEVADLDYLDRFEQNDLFAPEATLIVMNSGLVMRAVGGLCLSVRQSSQDDWAVDWQGRADCRHAVTCVSGRGHGSQTFVRGGDGREGRRRRAKCQHFGQTPCSEMVDC